MTQYQVGDAPVITYRLYDPSVTPPIPVDAVVTLAITDPSGATTIASPLHPSLGVYTYALTLVSSGLWFVKWTATGAVTDAETIQIYAADSDAPETLRRPAWSPQLEDVAVHIPTRTRAVGVDDDYLGTFTDATTPTGDEVARIIDHATAWVVSFLGAPVVDDAYAQAQVAASLWAAYWVELGYPERNADVAVYERLRVDAVAMTTAAADLNAAAGGGTSTDPTPGNSALPTYSFPDPPSWADTSLFW